MTGREDILSILEQHPGVVYSEDYDEDGITFWCESDICDWTECLPYFTSKAEAHRLHLTDVFDEHLWDVWHDAHYSSVLEENPYGRN